jgi:hypothetical protein
VIAGAVAALALLTVSAQAGGSGARLSDPAGDMPVPSLDVVSGVIRLDASSMGRTLSMTATMTGDLTGVPADYDLVTGIRRGDTCHSLATRVRWDGVTLAQSYQHTSSFACNGDVTPAFLASLAGEAAQYAASGDPVAATAGGHSVSVTLPAPAWFRPGSLAGFAVLSHTTAVGFSSYGAYGQVGTYDLAGIDHEWRVG